MVCVIIIECRFPIVFVNTCLGIGVDSRMRGLRDQRHILSHERHMISHNNKRHAAEDVVTKDFDRNLEQTDHVIETRSVYCSRELYIRISGHVLMKL